MIFGIRTIIQATIVLLITLTIINILNAIQVWESKKFETIQQVELVLLIVQFCFHVILIIVLRSWKLNDDQLNNMMSFMLIVIAIFQVELMNIQQRMYFITYPQLNRRNNSVQKPTSLALFSCLVFLNKYSKLEKNKLGLLSNLIIISYLIFRDTSDSGFYQLISRIVEWISACSLLLLDYNVTIKVEDENNNKAINSDVLISQKSEKYQEQLSISNQRNPMITQQYNIEILEPLNTQRVRRNEFQHFNLEQLMIYMDRMHHGVALLSMASDQVTLQFSNKYLRKVLDLESREEISVFLIDQLQMKLMKIQSLASKLELRKHQFTNVKKSEDYIKSYQYVDMSSVLRRKQIIEKQQIRFEQAFQTQKSIFNKARSLPDEVNQEEKGLQTIKLYILVHSSEERLIEQSSKKIESIIEKIYEVNQGGSLSLNMLFKLIESEASIDMKDAIVDDELILTFYVNCQAREDMKKRSFKLQVSILQMDGIYYMLTIEDISHLEMYCSMKENDQFKTNIFRSFSHELKTPLNSIMAKTQGALDDDKVNKKTKTEYLFSILKSSQLQLACINDILDFIQIQSNQLQLSVTSFNLREIVEQILQLVYEELDQKKLGLDFSYDCQNNDFISTDHNRLSQVLLNIIRNAVKFTFQGKISLSVKRVSESLIQFQIQDSGIGIKEQDLSRLKLALQELSLEHKITENSTGCGFGLTVSQFILLYLAPQEKQQLEIVSFPDQGSNFTFYIVDQQRPRSSVQVVQMSVSMHVSSFIHSSDGSEANGRDFFLSNTHLQTNAKFVTYLNQKFKQSENIRGSQHSFSNKPYGRLLQAQVSWSRLKQNTNRQTSIESQMLRGDQLQDSLQSANGMSHSCYCNRVLCADDDVFNHQAVAILFKKMNLIIDSSYNGEQAINKLLRVKADLDEGKGCGHQGCTYYKFILMDYNMPVMDGIQATKNIIELIKQRKIPNIPIIGCTAYSGKELNECLECGMVDVIEKPIMYHSLLTKLQRWVSSNSYVKSHQSPR